MARRPVVPDELRHGPFTVVEAERAGLTWKRLQGASWRRIGAGQYVWAGLRSSPDQILATVSHRLPEGAAFAGRTAGWAHGLDLPPCDPIEVTVPPRSPKSALAGASVRRAPLRSDDIVTRRDLPVTSALQTVVDLARFLAIAEAVVAVDMALRQRLVRLTDLTRHVEASAGAKGVGQLRSVVDLAEPDAESAMETRLRMLLVMAGLPRPRVQVSLHDEQGRFVGRADLYYPAARLCLEYDGRTHRDSLVDDNRRQNRLLNAGFRILRFTASDVYRSPDSVVHQVRAALEKGDSSDGSP